MDTAVGLVKAYLELCGYFVLTELPVRAADNHGYHDVTDVDIIAVRFPHAPICRPRNVRRPLKVFLGIDPELGSFEAGVDLLVGEVKEGKARVNPALRRTETVAFALRRVGCCPEAKVDEQAWMIAQAGAKEMAMPGGLHCRVRLVAFAGHGSAAEPGGHGEHGVQGVQGVQGVHTISLAHCSEYISGRLREARDVLQGVHFKDPTLGLLALQEKLAHQYTGK